MVEELPEQVELLRRELEVLLTDAGLATARIDLEVAVLDHGAFEVASFQAGAPKDRFHARDELTRIERLGQIVVGAHLEPDDLVDVLVAGGEHEDQDVGRLPDPAAHLDPVDIGEHEVEHDQGGASTPPRRSPRSRSGGAHAEARLPEVHADEGRDAPSSSTTRMDWLLAGVTRFLSCQRPRRAAEPPALVGEAKACAAGRHEAVRAAVDRKAAPSPFAVEREVARTTPSASMLRPRMRTPGPRTPGRTRRGRDRRPSSC